MTDAEAISEALRVVKKHSESVEDDFMFEHYQKVITQLEKLLAALKES